VSGKGSWIGIAVIVALIVLLGLKVLLNIEGAWPEVIAVVVLLGTLAFGLSR